MNNKLSFSDFQKLCEANLNVKYVNDLITEVNNNDCLFNSGIILPHEKMASLYSLRFEIAKEKMLNDEYLKDYESSVDNLKASTSEHLGAIFLFTEQHFYFIFYEPESKTILGILKSNNSESLTQMERNNDKTVNEGHSSSFEKYSKGVFIKSWN